MEAQFKTASGGDPATYVLSLAGAMKPTEADALYAAQRQRTRIVERTLRGVDVNGNPFEPYSTDGPYYYYPNGGRKTTAKQNKAAVRRLLRATAHVTAGRSEYQGYMGVGGVKTRNGQGIRYESYADFKASLGRAGVDLTGPRAPHMLQAIVVSVNDRAFGVSDSASGGTRPVEVFALGIYGEAAGRASAHNTGYSPRWKRKHQRYFLGANSNDLKDILNDIYARMSLRMKGRA